MPESLSPARDGILVVEDCPEDIESLRWAFGRLPVPRRLRHCWSGDEALELLAGESAQGRLPGLLLLDLNLPGTDGLEVLRRLKQDGRLRPIPVVILSATGDGRKAEAGKRLGAGGFHRKPDGLPALLELARSLEDRWFGSPASPGREAAA